MKTLADRTAKFNALGASFFSKDEGNRKAARWFFQVLRIILLVTDLAGRINDALERDPDAVGRGIHAQLDFFYCGPL